MKKTVDPWRSLEREPGEAPDDYAKRRALMVATGFQPTPSPSCYRRGVPALGVRSDVGLVEGVLATMSAGMCLFSCLVWVSIIAETKASPLEALFVLALGLPLSAAFGMVAYMFVGK